MQKRIEELERQLAETKEENIRAENIRHEFVANVTHELKTPLTSIAGFAETLEGSAGDDPAVRSKFLNIIMIETQRLARLIDDILVLSDIESGREVPKDVDIDVKQAVCEVLGALEPQANAKDISLHFEAESEICIGGDYDRFKEMMFNLIENAIKYTGSGKNVYVTAEKVIGEDAEDKQVIICVRDEGIGISDENIPRLFERFYRVEKSRSRNVGGTGLGLAIVKHIAALMDAEVSVKSKVGEGSNFTVKFKKP
jgi:two-component system phosphate regulon sensor histidine kinase PhoR